MKHRLLYDEAQQLARTYGVHQIICGYMRNFKIEDTTLEGICSISRQKCRREIPVDLKDCEVYANWLIERIRNVRD
jgi:hypothetical protein